MFGVRRSKPIKRASKPNNGNAGWLAGSDVIDYLSKGVPHSPFPHGLNNNNNPCFLLSLLKNRLENRLECLCQRTSSFTIQTNERKFGQSLVPYVSHQLLWMYSRNELRRGKFCKKSCLGTDLDLAV